MNKLFGFFREKLVEAKAENEKEIQNIMSGIDSEPYSQEKMLSYMQ